MQHATFKTKSINCRNFINGEFIDAIDGKVFENINPATEEVIGWVAEATREEVDAAVQSAKAALKGPWGKFTVKERSLLLRRIGDLILENVEELAALETIDTGKPYHLAIEMDIKRAAHNFHFFADYVTSLGNESYNQDNMALHYSVTRPVGVVAMINPWNLPLLLLTWKLAPCLAAGSTAVMKPAELTPMTATRLVELCQEAGIPDGVVNLVHGFGGNSAGAFLSEHPDVDAITFTGETKTGTTIMKAAAPTLKKVSFELGGKNPTIIFKDSDLDEVLATTLKSSFTNQGQVCLCGSRIYVERDIYKEFVEKFVARTKELKIGDPFDATTDIGSVVGKEHYEKVMGYIQIAREEGGNILTGGGRPATIDKGYYIEPTIITDLTDQDRCVREEIFGPVVTVLPFDTEDDVISRANDTNYGLGATIWTNDLRRAHRVAGQIESGIVWVNTWYLRDLRTPFGGMKHSGIGREGGAHSFEFYCEVSNVTIKL
ncbi:MULTISPECIES: aldehyde dehydrogenase [Lysinibacillus]|jgi:aminomuconate-semialdehyde/2-hydroxymuconate-6-semialdehyde dehydrogenase|uniref:5-carboxymethyl-2-hydroxymuconate semialdehyde dehydrogenase n=2 Tax=Lysinibacillus TaxID=400634 RepID=A0A2I0V2S4_9BACI|nr:MULTISPECIES: aldehyde dehydrogenase [Lysinibacillus]KUF32502.1 2-hydroxymuconic semialdehyde dehydrogenase [Lysinibacillus sp. F5]MEE3808271.1 aldehyde dehydrogenase [Lysinibacillus fusiformis]PKU52607.1 5-carboxymethyl-2-hydroxymuconate semialdehyde dehydrogenase [Lysinibacillus fusiformis]WCH47048.1 aldehyde dehydrogenase [Lysinibacillus sp. OF-1]SCY87603.1 aminomuconate-semialdehyde/2-hydroxymuconate-6-semialdehyde dehydrogenase [Lysinibacillus sp. SG9]